MVSRVRRVLESGRSIRAILGETSQLCHLVITASGLPTTNEVVKSAERLLFIIEGGIEDYDAALARLPYETKTIRP